MDEVFSEQHFPMHGLSLVSELESQPPGTTPEGINVRAYESLTHPRSRFSM